MNSKHTNDVPENTAPCASGGIHDLQSPRALFGAPAFDAHGGALRREACAKCGLYIFTDSKGETTTYPADAESLALTVPLSERRRQQVGNRPRRHSKGRPAGKRTASVPTGD